MWQVVLGAAIAGSTGFVANRFLNPFSRDDSRLSDDCNGEKEPVTPPSGIGFLNSDCDKSNGVFRFSSSGSGSGSFKKSSGVKCKVRVRGLMKKNRGLMKKKKKNGGECKIEKGSENVGKSEVCVKKPRTSASASASKRGSCYNNQDHSSVSSVLGVCMMYMMSTEKGEISKLHAATEETAKVIQELKDELSRIKSLQSCAASSEISSRKSGPVSLNRSEMESRESLDIKSGNDGGYASSVLTEEPEQEAVEMERLEMELESELQKLNLAETSEAMEECKDLVNGSVSYQCGGISASELDKKLSHLLIEQQEGQINELEAELQTTQSKLQEKESELQALKVCVRRLTEFPLLDLDRSDDEHEQGLNQDPSSVSWSQHNQTDKEQRKPTIGMKRPMESSINV